MASDMISGYNCSNVFKKSPTSGIFKLSYMRVIIIILVYNTG